jgi:WD40 repeat protein
MSRVAVLLGILTISRSPAKSAEADRAPLPVRLEVETYLKTTAAAFSPDGRFIASGGLNGVLKLIDAESLRLVHTLAGHSTLFIFAVAFSPDGTVLAIGAGDGLVNVWDVESGSLRTSLKADKNCVRALAFSPDGALLAGGDCDGKVKLWSASTWEPAGILRGHSAEVRGLAFDPNGKTLASASSDHTIKLWDLKARRPLRRLERRQTPVPRVRDRERGPALLPVQGRLPHPRPLVETPVGERVRDGASSRILVLLAGCGRDRSTGAEST